MKRLIYVILIWGCSNICFSQDRSFTVKDLTDTLIIKTLFDTQVIDSDGDAIWKPNFAESFQFNVLEDNMCHTRLDTVIYFDSSKYAALIFSTAAYTCHACAPDMSIAVFQKWTDGRWNLERMKKFVTKAGSYGGLPDLKLEQFGKTSYCLEMDWYNMGQGYSEEGVLLYDLYDFNEIFSLQTHEDNYGTGDKEYSWDKMLKFIPSKKSPYYYDIIISSTGTQAVERNADSRIIKLSGKKRYHYDDEKYVLVK